MSHAIELVRARRLIARKKATISFWIATIFLSGAPVLAAENGAGVYLLGMNGPEAAVLPPPGVFLQNDFYLYSGTVVGTKTLPLGNNVTLNAQGLIRLELPTVLWSTPWTVLGGRVALFVSGPTGGPNISADVTAGPLTGHQSDSVFTLGDPLVGGSIGWDVGDYHWKSTVFENVPIGN